MFDWTRAGTQTVVRSSCGSTPTVILELDTALPTPFFRNSGDVFSVRYDTVVAMHVCKIFAIVCLDQCFTIGKYGLNT